MQGWITLHRQVKEHWIWSDPQKFQWWIDILLRANHKDNKILFNGELTTIERGSFHTSEVKLSEQWNVSRNRVRRFLSLLEEDEMIATNRTTNGTTIKVLNYSVYQGFSNENKQPTEQSTEQPTIQQTNSQRYSGRYSRRNTNNNDNNEITMNNNDNNENKSVGVVSENINPDYSEIIKEYNKLAFGLPTERTYEQINEWLKLHNKELIIHVMQYAHDLGKHNLSYVNGILRNAKQKQIETVADFEAENNRFTASKSNSYANSLEARIAREQVKQKAERDKQNIKTVIDPNEELPF